MIPTLFRNDLTSELFRDPFREWDRFFAAPEYANGAKTHLTPRYEVAEKEDGFLLSLDIPGVKKEEIKIETKGRTLSVSANRHSGKEKEAREYHYRATFELPEVVALEGTEASYQDGVLTLALPKVKEATARTIKVGDGRGDFLGKLVQGFKKEDAKKEASA